MIESILSILSESKPEIEFEQTSTLFDSGILDSFDLLIIVSELESAFEISIPGELLIPENFNTPLDIKALVEKLTKI